VSTGIPTAIEAPRFRALTSVRATGIAGIASAIILAAATFAAIFGPLLAPHDPELPNLSLAWICSGSTSRAATCSPGCW
jgi:oligopeptide transport permease C-like protein